MNKLVFAVTSRGLCSYTNHRIIALFRPCTNVMPSLHLPQKKKKKENIKPHVNNSGIK